MLNSEPQNASAAAIQKWKELEPLNLERLLDDNQLEFDPKVHKNVVKESLKQNGNNFDYVGQVDSQNIANGIGRTCIYGDRIIEGQVINGKLNGYARVIYNDGMYY